MAALLILPRRWKHKLILSGLFVAGTLPWMLAWTVRNRVEAENATNRILAWHPITHENISIGLRTVSEFLIPVEAWRQVIHKQTPIIELLIVIILGAVLVWLAFKTWKYLTDKRTSEKGLGEVISFTTGFVSFGLPGVHCLIDADVRCGHQVQAPHPGSIVCLSAHSFGLLWHLAARQEASAGGGFDICVSGPVCL